MFGQLIRTNFENLQHYLAANRISAYRLISRSERFPVSVDIYLDNAVIQVFATIDGRMMSELELALSQNIQIKEFFYKNRTKEAIGLPSSSKKIIYLEEYGNKFKVNLSDYLDTGLFLDHRETRHWLAAQCRGKIVLNTFAYSGSFSVYAARSGAVKTFSVDISRVYCEWIKENLILNDLPLQSNWIVKMDTLQYFKYAQNKLMKFDIIILDPPTFSKNKGRSFSVQKNHPILINHALELLSPGGFILFSTNYRDFVMSKKEIQKCSIKEKTDSLPPDFSGSYPHRCFIITN